MRREHVDCGSSKVEIPHHSSVKSYFIDTRVAESEVNCPTLPFKDFQLLNTVRARV